MKKKFILFLNNFVFLFHFNFLESTCNSANPLIQEEKLDTLFHLKTNLEEGLNASKLSVHNTRKEGFEFLKKHIKKASPLSILNWKDLTDQEEKLSYKEDNIFNLEISWATKNIEIQAKLINIRNKLKYKIDNLLKKWKGSIEIEDLDNWDNWKTVFQKKIINHPHLTHNEYGFNKDDLKLKPNTDNNKLNVGENIIPIIIKLDDLEEEFFIKIRAINECDGEKVYKRISNLIVTKREITSKHKSDSILKFINKKRKHLAKDYDNISITKVISINDKKNYLVEGKNNLLVRFEDNISKKNYNYNILLNNVALFNKNDAIKNLSDIFKKQKQPFILKQNNKWEDLKKIIIENNDINKNYLFTEKFSLELSDSNFTINTKTITKYKELRNLNIRFKVNDVFSKDILIYYQVII